MAGVKRSLFMLALLALLNMPFTTASPHGDLLGLFCHHHTSTCIHYTVTKTKTKIETSTCPTKPAATVTKTTTKSPTCPPIRTVTKTHTVTSTSLPVPTDACSVVDPTCKPSGFTVDYYANPFFGYSYPQSGLTSGYYISEKLKPINSSATNITYFPQDMIPNDGTYPLVYPNSSFPTAPYYVGYTRNIDGITVDGNNFTLVYQGLYKAPSTGNFTFCTLADNENDVFYGSGNGFPCGGKPSANATPSQSGGVATGGNYNNPTSCFVVNLLMGAYYPFRLVMADYQGPSALGFTVTPPGGTATNDFTGFAYPPSCAKKVG